jgi:hypothetical protein
MGGPMGGPMGGRGPSGGMPQRLQTVMVVLWSRLHDFDAK